MSAKVINVKVKNGEVPVIKFGEGEKTLIILPGLSYDGVAELKDAIEQSYSLFCDKYTVYLIERNVNPCRGYTIENVADDVYDAATELGVKGADVFGVSMGGAAAQMLAVKYKGFVHSLVLGSTFCRINDNMRKVIGEWKVLAYDVKTLTKNFAEKVYSESTLKKYEDVLTVPPIFTEDKSKRFEIYCSACLNFDVYERLNELPAKTFVIGAAEDKVTTPAAAKEIAQKSGAKYYEYKTFGHAVFDEATDYKQRILDFLQ
ncbi:MAG: alpha/beta hydrolase [Clostridia bacterium]|nr:alpha/beta hydrolase [Clostridia bacterium]